MACEGHPGDKRCRRCGHWTLTEVSFGTGWRTVYYWECRNCGVSPDSDMGHPKKEPKYKHFPISGEVCAGTICGKTLKPKIWITTTEKLVTCPRCLKRRRGKQGGKR